MRRENYHFYYSDHYEVELDPNHRFPMNKYSLLRNSLIEKGIVKNSQITAAQLINIDHLYLAHTPDYIEQVLDLSLSREKARAIGLPLNEEMVRRALGSQGAFWQAVTSSLDTGFSASLAGGTHHAHADSGEGFCFFNDFAVNVRRLHRERPGYKILILDLDVHQGNGNSSILNKDKDVFIASYHGKNNYPYRKVPSHLDRSFADGTGDEEYLRTLGEDLSNFSKMGFQHLLYQAGVDSLKGDAFGKLSISHEGLKERDRMVFEFVKRNQIPLTMALGGGYSKDVTQTVNAYIGTYEVAKEVFS